MGNYQTLEKQHQEILNILNKISVILKEKNSSGCAEDLYKLLTNLQSLLNRHFLLEDDYMYPVLREHPDKRIRNVVNSFFAEIEGLKQEFFAYTAKWNSVKDITDSYELFLSETQKIVIALKNRIDREDKSLFPAIARITQVKSNHKKNRFNILNLSKWLLITSGVLFIINSILIFAGIHHPCCGWPYPCPISLLFFGAGIILFGISSDAFKSNKNRT